MQAVNCGSSKLVIRLNRIDGTSCERDDLVATTLIRFISAERRGSRDQRQYVLDVPSIMRDHYSNLRASDYKYHYYLFSLPNSAPTESMFQLFLLLLLLLTIRSRVARDHRFNLLSYFLPFLLALIIYLYFFF